MAIKTKMENTFKKQLKNNRNTKLKQNKHNDDDSSEEDNDSYVSEDETETDTSDSSYIPPVKHKKKKSSNISRSKLQNTISKLYPSKYMKKRAKTTSKYEKKIKRNKMRKNKKHSSSEDDESEDEESESEYEESDDGESEDEESEEEESEYEESEEEESVDDLESEEESDDDFESDYDDETEETDETDESSKKKSNKKNKKSNMVNILLSLGNNTEEDEYIEDDKECNSDDEHTFMKETFTNMTNIEQKQPLKKPESPKKKLLDDDVEKEYLELAETKQTLMKQLQTKPKSKILLNAINECKKSINKLVKRSRNKNAKKYHKLINKNNIQTNEVEYFKKKMSNKEQLNIMQQMEEINKHINIDKPYRLALLDAKIPAKFKSIAMQKLNILRSMERGDPEYYKLQNWIDTFMKIPFGKYMNLSINITDGLDKCHEYMETSKQTLDQCVFGLNDAKLQIMQMIGQWITNPSALGTAIAIKGPMGTGKTTLVKEGISKILGREFTFIALGGTGDSAFLEGHSYTYEGSTWGKIVQILIESKCMNPVIYFDELDKVSDTPRGAEIIGILTHLTDVSQNSEFHDKYFSEIHFDLSKCLFIFSYNDETKINPILRDRMYHIQTKGYDTKEKIIIARDHILPKIQEQVKFTPEDIIISDDVLTYIITTAGFTNNESGVRNLKRCLEIIYTKLNLFRLIKPDTQIFSKDMDIVVSFPFVVLKQHVDILIKDENKQSQSMLAMYV